MNESLVASALALSSQQRLVELEALVRDWRPLVERHKNQLPSVRWEGDCLSVDYGNQRFFYYKHNSSSQFPDTMVYEREGKVFSTQKARLELGVGDDAFFFCFYLRLDNYSDDYVDYLRLYRRAPGVWSFEHTRFCPLVWITELAARPLATALEAARAAWFPK